MSDQPTDSISTGGQRAQEITCTEAKEAWAAGSGETRALCFRGWAVKGRRETGRDPWAGTSGERLSVEEKHRFTRVFECKHEEEAAF